MKSRLVVSIAILVTALGAASATAGPGAGRPLRPAYRILAEQHARTHSPTPVDRIILQEQATRTRTQRLGHISPAQRIVSQEKARRLDPRIYGTPSSEAAARPTVQIDAAGGGFHWGDAGIGIGAAVGVMLLAFGFAIIARNSRPKQA
jgi:hypothetical protein